MPRFENKCDCIDFTTRRTPEESRRDAVSRLGEAISVPTRIRLHVNFDAELPEDGFIYGMDKSSLESLREILAEEGMFHRLVANKSGTLREISKRMESPSLAEHADRLTRQANAPIPESILLSVHRKPMAKDKQKKKQ